MANLRNVVYLTQDQYDTLLTNGSISYQGGTLTYSANDLYLVKETGGGGGGGTAHYLHEINITNSYGTQIHLSQISLSNAPLNTAEKLYNVRDKLLVGGYSLLNDGTDNGIFVAIYNINPIQISVVAAVLEGQGSSYSIKIMNFMESTLTITDTVTAL